VTGATDPPDPIRLGVLHDFPQPDGGKYFESGLRLGLETREERLDREIELITRHERGLPGGTAHAVQRGFRELAVEGCLAVIGPSISDNGILIRDLADRERIPCINYTGGAITRSKWMFHYQVGSLEEEPAVLARHLRERGLTTVAVAHDDTPVGDNYRDWLLLAAATAGIDVVGQAAVSPMAEDVTEPVRRLISSQPQALCYLGLGVAARAVALAVQSLGWEGPVVANSALMFGYGRPDWREGWEGWSYCDLIGDDNRERQYLSQRSRALAGGPIGVAAYDIGRLLGEGLVRAANLSRPGLQEGLERVKRLPAAGGAAGTLMGFGAWDHAALKGEFLVLRGWRDGRSVEVTS